jgi:NADPH-dependent 2,4-dienoyl-CoA reductase/sulfur reductase-like enzyme
VLLACSADRPPQFTPPTELNFAPCPTAPTAELYIHPTMAAQLVDGQAGLPVANSTRSYWHKEPSERLLGHRTTDELPSHADVVIVGSGITGAIAAHTLKQRRPELKVVMLEAREACWGATGRVSI